MSAADHEGEPQPVEQQPDERQLLRDEIERVREDLGETVEALAGKADVKGQVQDKVQDTKTQVQHKVEDVKAQLGGGGDRPVPATTRGKLESPAVPAVVAAACALLLLRSILRSRR